MAKKKNSKLKDVVETVKSYVGLASSTPLLSSERPS